MSFNNASAANLYHNKEVVDKNIILSQSTADIIYCQGNKSENDEVSTHKLSEIKAIAVENIVPQSKIAPQSSVPFKAIAVENIVPQSKIAPQSIVPIKAIAIENMVPQSKIAPQSSVPESAADRVLTEPTDAIELRNLQFLQQALKCIIVDYENLPEVTLKGYLCNILDSALIKHPEYSENFFNAFTSLYNFIQNGCRQEGSEWLKEVNIKFDVIYKDINSTKPPLLPFIMQIGGKWLDRCLHSILEREVPFESNFKNLLKSFFDKNKAVSIFCDHLIQAFSPRFKYFDELDSLKESLKSLSHVLPKNQRCAPCLEKKWSVKIKTINNFVNSFRLIKNSLISGQGVEFSSRNEYLIVNDYMFAKIKFHNDFITKSMLKTLKFFTNSFVESRSALDNYFDYFMLCHKFCTKAENEKIKQIAQSIDSLRIQLLDLSNLLTKGAVFMGNFSGEVGLFYFNYKSIHGIKSDTEIHQSMSWLMFENEIDVNLKESKVETTVQKDSMPNEKKLTKIQLQTPKLKNENININAHSIKSSRTQTKNNELLIQNKSTNSLCLNNSFSNLNTSIKISKQKHEEILDQNLLFIQSFSKKIKKCLELQGCEGKLKTPDFVKAKLHSKEFRDHLHYASLNFDLFCKSFIGKDLYAVGGLFSFLCFDLHLTLEQLIKHQIAVKGMPPSTSHDLLELCVYASIEIPSELSSFVQELSNAMLLVRYPIAWSNNKQTTSLLEKIQNSQRICQIINGDIGDKTTSIDPVKIVELGSFVVESYKKTLQFIIQVLPLSSDCKKLVAKSCENLESIKNIIDDNQSIVNKRNRVKEKAIAIKNSCSVMNVEDSILKLRQKLLDFGKSMLNTPNIEQKAQAEQALEEASNHLLRIDVVNYIEKNYSDLKYVGLHQRNLLTFQWVFEQFYKFNGYVNGVGDLNWAGHDFELYHALIYPGQSLHNLEKAFNFRRNVHYNHEVGPSKSLKMVQDLLHARKDLKHFDPLNSGWSLATQKNKNRLVDFAVQEEKMKECRAKILNDGKQLLKALIAMSLSEKDKLK